MFGPQPVGFALAARAEALGGTPPVSASTPPARPVRCCPAFCWAPHQPVSPRGGGTPPCRVGTPPPHRTRTWHPARGKEPRSAGGGPREELLCL